MTIKKPEEKRWKELVKNTIYELYPSIIEKLKKLGLHHPDFSQGGIDSPNSVMYFSTAKHKAKNIPFNPQDILKLLELVPEIKDEVVEYQFDDIPSLIFDNLWFLEEDETPLIIQTKNKWFMVNSVILAEPKKIEVEKPKKIEIQCPVCKAGSEMIDPFLNNRGEPHPARWNFPKGTIVKLFVCKECQTRLSVTAHITIIQEG